MIRKSNKKGFLTAAEMDLQEDQVKRTRKVDCPVCRSVIFLEAVTNEGDVILCPYCDSKLIVSGLYRRPTVHSIDLYGPI